jgi:hypothetical protein
MVAQNQGNSCYDDLSFKANIQFNGKNNLQSSIKNPTQFFPLISFIGRESLPPLHKTRS